MIDLSFISFFFLIQWETRTTKFNKIWETKFKYLTFYLFLNQFLSKQSNKQIESNQNRNPNQRKIQARRERERERERDYMIGTLVEISGQKLWTRLLRLERAWSLSEGCVSFSIASSPPAELTIVTAMATEDFS